LLIGRARSRGRHLCESFALSKLCRVMAAQPARRSLL